MASGLASLGKGRTVSTLVWLSHATSSAVGGTLMMLALWLALTPARTLLPALALEGTTSFAVLTCILIDSGLTDAPKRRQVPQGWFARYGPTRSFSAYGAILGLALFTPITSAVVYGVFFAGATWLGLGGALVLGCVLG